MAEANDLDGKSELPPLKGLPQTDFPEDVAAMASRSTPPPLNARLRTSWPWYGLPGEAIDNDEYQVRAGIDWTGGQPFTILTLDNMDSMMYRSPCTASRESKRP